MINSNPKKHENKTNFGIKFFYQNLTVRFFQIISALTALIPFFSGEIVFFQKIILSILIWWAWLAAAQITPSVPDFLFEKQWLVDSWSRGWRYRTVSCFFCFVYFPIFISKNLFFIIAILAFIVYSATKFI